MLVDNFFYNLSREARYVEEMNNLPRALVEARQELGETRMELDLLQARNLGGTAL